LISRLRTMICSIPRANGVAVVMLCALFVPVARSEQHSTGSVITSVGTARTQLHDGHAVVDLPRRQVWRPMCGSKTAHLSATEFSDLVKATSPPAAPAGVIAAAGTPPAPRFGLDIVFTFLTAIPAGAAEAFTEIERDLESRFTDDATVQIEVEFQGGLGSGILGGTTAEYILVPYPILRDALQADMDPDDIIQSSLPPGTTVPVRYLAASEDVTNVDRVFVTLANHEATVGAVEMPAARLTFNSDINWAFAVGDLVPPTCTNTIGVSCCTAIDCPGIPGVCSNSGTSCIINGDCPPGGACGTTGACEPKVFSFRDVLMHELVHVFGFTSAIDTRVFEMETLDLFRFQESDGLANHNPDTLAEFATTPRMVQLDPLPPFANDDAVCDLITTEYRMSDGNPNQASHFSPTIAQAVLMEPLFCPGNSLSPSFIQTPDLMILDAIGWDTPPANTSCNQADQLACGLTRWVDNSLTTGAPSPAPTCGIGAAHDGAMWFSFTATHTSARLSTCGSVATDSTLAVFEGSCGALTEIGCSEDDGCGGTGSLAEICMVDLTIGETYYVQLSSKTTTDRGQFAIELYCGCDLTCSDVCCQQFAAPLIATDVVDMGRFLAFEPSAVSRDLAVRLTLSSLHHPSPANLNVFPAPDYSSLEGQTRWLGPVENFIDSPGQLTSFRASRTQCTPDFQSWETESVVYITGAAIVPSSEYRIEFVSEECIQVFGESAPATNTLNLTTSRWGDISPPYQDPLANGNAIQPNVFDITAVVDRVKDLETALGRPQVQLIPAEIEPNRPPTVLDITVVLDAVKGSAYPFEADDVCAP